MKKRKILFLCIHNSARSQIAQAYMKKYGSLYFEAESAGLEAGTLNPLAVEVLKEEGIDISRNKTTNVNVYFDEGRKYDYVITVCDEASSARCPLFPGVYKKLNWSFIDPSSLQGSQEEKLKIVREVRDKIKDAVLKFIQENKKND